MTLSTQKYIKCGCFYFYFLHSTTGAGTFPGASDQSGRDSDASVKRLALVSISSPTEGNTKVSA